MEGFKNELSREALLDGENKKRLQVLMGDSYDGTEMSDYLSYFHPDQMTKEIDLLEKKKGMFDDKELFKKFKEHLSYLSIMNKD
jgi:hypothetical protein